MSLTLHYGADHICTCRRPTELRSPLDALRRSGRHLTRKLHGWIERRRQRQALQDLDDHFLKDIGVSRAAAMQEASKPFWM